MLQWARGSIHRMRWLLVFGFLLTRQSSWSSSMCHRRIRWIEEANFSLTLAQGLGLRGLVWSSWREMSEWGQVRVRLRGDIDVQVGGGAGSWEGRWSSRHVIIARWSSFEWRSSTAVCRCMSTPRRWFRWTSWALQNAAWQLRGGG